MKAPRWARVLLRSLAPPGRADDVLGDLEEAHRRNMRIRGPAGATLRTSLETLDMAAALVRTRLDIFGSYRGSGTLHDYKLGVRMLRKYPGLTLAGGLALAIAIGLGAAWWEFMGDGFRPSLNLPGGERLVEIEMRTIGDEPDERRIAHDFTIWRRDAKQLEHLGAYRTTGRNVIRGDATPEPVTVAETTASMFQAVPVPPLHGRPLIDADEEPGAPPVVVLGYDVWRRWFGGRADAIGETLQLGNVRTTVVGVMPQGFAFPINHKLWVPLSLKTSGYAPLDGPAITVFARIADGATQAQANAEIMALHESIKKASLTTHERLAPRVLAWGGQSPGDRPLVEILLIYAPIALVLLIACANVGTLIYARTATRDAEISMRYALGATRGRIVTQLFVEALVLASVAAAVGLVFANWALKFGLTAFYSTQPTGMPFWVDPGLAPRTIVFAVALTIVGAAILGVLPGLKATGKNAQAQLRNLGSGGSTLRFGAVWTGAMIAQVALTVLCIVPATGISEESWRDHVIRGKFPADQYLAVEIDVDPPAAATAGEQSSAAFAAHVQRTYGELERRIAQEPGVRSITFADRLPGMGVGLRTAEVEVTRGAAPQFVGTMWTAAVGPNFFQSFDIPMVAGRDFHDGDRGAKPTHVIVNEAFARQFLNGANPVGTRVRFATAETQEPWFEIVGMVRDIGMTPTDLGEAPYVYRPASLTATSPIVMGIRAAGDHVALAQQIRRFAADIDPGLRLGEVGSLDDLAWRIDLPQMVVAGALATVVGLGLFLSAAGIFSLMSVSISRRTKEIGIRAALGASHSRILLGVFRRALLLVGSGVLVGNTIIVAVAYLSEEVGLGFLVNALIATSSIMMTVGLLACIQPARRALRIQPTDALREA